MMLCPPSTPQNSLLLVMIPLVRFHSKQCIIIYHTHNESALEWSSCSGWGIMASVFTEIMMMKRDNQNDALSPSNNASKACCWWCFHLLESNPNSASSFIIPIMSHWNGPAAVDGALWHELRQKSVQHFLYTNWIITQWPISILCIGSSYSRWHSFPLKDLFN